MGADQTSSVYHTVKHLYRWLERALCAVRCLLPACVFCGVAKPNQNQPRTHQPNSFCVFTCYLCVSFLPPSSLIFSSIKHQSINQPNRYISQNINISLAQITCFVCFCLFPPPLFHRPSFSPHQHFLLFSCTEFFLLPTSSYAKWLCFFDFIHRLMPCFV